MALARLFLAASLLVSLGRGDGDDPWEWAGAFNFATAGHFVWSAARGTAGSYAAPNLTLVVTSISTATAAALTAAHSAADTLWDGNVTELQPNADIEAVDAAYRLMMNQRTWVTNFELHVDTPGAYAFFARPAPTDFENGFHYLRTETGANVEPVAQESSHADGHSHGHDSIAHTQAALCPAEEHWEWGGVFHLQPGWHTWSAERSASGSYADATMRIVLIEVANSSEHEVEEAVAAGKPLWDGSATAKSSGATLALSTLQELTFDTHSWASYFYVNVASEMHVAIFAQHLPTEFETGFHYFKKADGSSVEPEVQKSCAAPSAAPATATENDGLWGAVLVGSLVTCLPTLFGILFFVADAAQAVRDFLTKTQLLLNAFASGVIFAAAVFLLLPEALHLAGSGHSEEVVGTWTWGTSILVGWFSCLAMNVMARFMFRRGVAEPVAADDDTVDKPLDKASVVAIAGPVLFGDFFHNFSDGLVIGVAFKACGTSFGWELVGVTFAHEFPQEIADLLVLVLNAKMKWWKATVLNFLCSLSTVIGAIITYSADVGSNEKGYILAYGGGVYLYVAVTEIGRYLTETQESKVERLALMLGSFILGCVLMGLVLLGHEHCSAPVVSADGTVVAAADPHGHGHHH